MFDIHLRDQPTAAERALAEAREQALRAALRCGALDPQLVAEAAGVHVTTVRAWADEPKYVGPSFEGRLFRWAEDVARGANPYAVTHTAPRARGGSPTMTQAAEQQTAEPPAAETVRQRGVLVLWENDEGFAWAWNRIPGEAEAGDGQADTFTEALERIGAEVALG